MADTNAHLNNLADCKALEYNKLLTVNMADTNVFLNSLADCNKRR